MRHRGTRAIALIACLGGLAIGAQSAGAAVYWGMQNGMIGRIDVDGGNLRAVLVDTDPGVLQVATNSTHVYWNNRFRGTIGRARLDGSEAEPSFVAAGGSPQGLAVDDDHVYWGDEDSFEIHRADAATGTVDGAFEIAAQEEPSAMALDGTHLYWINEGESIARARLDGTDVVQPLATGFNPRYGLALDAGWLYYSGGPAVGRVRLDGSAAGNFIPAVGTFNPLGIAAGGGHVYWVEDGVAADAVYRAAADGTGTTLLATTAGSSPWGVVYGPLLGRLARLSSPPAFPATTVGETSAVRTVTFRNDGGERAVQVSSATLVGVGADQFEITAEDCTDAPVAVDGECTAEVRFAPDASGAQSAALRLLSDANDGPGTIDTPLSATALTPPAFAFGPAPVFPDQEAGTLGPAQTVAIENGGESDLTIASVEVAGADAAEFQLDPGSCDDGPIAGGGDCTVSVRFDPDTAGAKTAQLRVVSDAASSPDTLALSATALAPAALRFGAAPTFPAVVAGALGEQRTVAIGNDGEVPLMIGEIALAGADAAQFELAAEDCTAAPLAGGASCEVAIRFTPTAPGAKAATLRVTSDAASSPDELSLSATALAPAPDPDPPTPPDPGPPAPPRPGPPVAIPPADAAPVAVAAATRRSPPRARVQRWLLDGRRSHDAEGRIVSYRWQIGGRTVGTSARQAIRLTARKRPYAITLTVTDAAGATASTRLTVRAPVPRVMTATIPASVAFPADSSYLDPAAERVVRRLRAQADGALRVEITGYSDDLGPAGYNRWLSERRARRVAAALLGGLRRRPARVTVRGAGAADPVASNTTAAGRAANRRVEVVIVTRR